MLLGLFANSHMRVLVPVSAVALLFAFAHPAWSQTAEDSRLFRKLNEPELRVERHILEHTGPLGVPKNKIPPRSKEVAASYVGMSNGELWKHLLESSQIAIIGIKEPGSSRGFYAGRSLVSDRTLKSAKRKLLGIKGVSKPRVESPTDLKMPVMPDRRFYPAVIVRFDSEKVLALVRGLPFVDFIEPLYPRVDYHAGIGCAIAAYVGSPSDGSFPFGGSNLLPWNYGLHHSISQAWGLFPATSAPGSGVDFFETDTGVFPSQRQFFEVFSSGSPVPRSFFQANYTGDARIKCSHGTRIAGLAAAPADGSLSPNIVGIGWGSSLLSQKVGDGVIHTDTPIPGLTTAIRDAASAEFPGFPLTQKRVLLMAWGMPYESQVVRDTIVTAYDTNPNLILVAAAGTAVSQVVFPATMRRETVAVTLVETPNAGVRSYGLIPPTSGTDTVAYGGEVDFVAANSVLTGLYVPTTGKGVNSVGQSVDKDGNLVSGSSLPAAETIEVTTLAGSSSAVSIIGAGIAVAWSRMPWLTRDQLLDRIVASASCSLITGLSAACRNANGKLVVGAGIPDFYRAAGGARSLWIDGLPQSTPGTPIVLSVGMDGDPELYDYTWVPGGSGQSATITLTPGQTISVSLTAVNKVDGTTLAAARTFTAAPTTARTLFATETIASWATFFDGHRLSANINGGATLPAGCFITGVAAQELLVGGPTPGAPWGLPSPTADYGNRGFSVARTAFGPENLDVLVTAWHDGFSSIRVRPVYFVAEPAGVDCNASGGTQTMP